MKILFICKHNRFRSRVASAYFNQLNENTKNISKGAGLFSDDAPLDKNEVSIARNFEIDIRGKPQKVNSELLNWADKILIVADDVPRESIKTRKNIIIWKIKDVYDTINNKKAVRETIQKIKKKVDEFVKFTQQ